MLLRRGVLGLVVTLLLARCGLIPGKSDCAVGLLLRPFISGWSRASGSIGLWCRIQMWMPRGIFPSLSPLLPEIKVGLAATMREHLV